MGGRYLVIAYRNGVKYTYRVKGRDSIAVQDYVERKYNVQVKSIERLPAK